MSAHGPELWATSQLPTVAFGEQRKCTALCQRLAATPSTQNDIDHVAVMSRGRILVAVGMSSSAKYHGSGASSHKGVS